MTAGLFMLDSLDVREINFFIQPLYEAVHLDLHLSVRLKIF